MLKYLLLCVVVSVNFNEVMGATAGALDNDTLKPPAPSATFPDGRVEAWGLYIHPLIQATFTKAGVEYPLDLKGMCNSTFHLIEQGMRSFFENDLEGNQARVQSDLAPALLQAEQEESTTDAKRQKQSAILMRMLNAHPIPKKW